jgi:nucleotide-binding universal stress UspA family protein
MWSFPPHRILVPVDFSEPSRRALRLGGELARTFDASLTVIHAETFEAPPYFTTSQIRAIDRQRKAGRAEARRYLQDYARRFAGVAPASAIISDTPPRNAVLDASRNADLVVMGTHGRRGPARWWAGSVTEGVVRLSAVPVLVVRSNPAPAEVIFRRLGVVARPGTFDGPARRYARGLAARFGGEVARESAPALTSEAMEGWTTILIAQPKSSAALGLPWDGGAHVLRSCVRPLLFVPPV